MFIIIFVFSPFFMRYTFWCILVFRIIFCYKILVYLIHLLIVAFAMHIKVRIVPESEALFATYISKSMGISCIYHYRNCWCARNLTFQKTCLIFRLFQCPKFMLYSAAKFLKFAILFQGLLTLEKKRRALNIPKIVLPLLCICVLICLITPPFFSNDWVKVLWREETYRMTVWGTCGNLSLW